MALIPLRQRTITAVSPGRVLVPNVVHRGTTTSNGLPTDVRDTATHAPFDATGRRLVMLEGPAANEETRIISDNGSSYIVNPALSDAPGAGNAYRITK